MVDPLTTVCAGMCAAGLAQTAAGWLAFRRFMRDAGPVLAARPPISVLKPLYGDEPLLEEALASLCAQDYPEFQVVFGLQNPGDPALRVLHRLRVRFPALDMRIVVDPALHGSNYKVSNLINMFQAARHDVLVVADSDVHAPPGYLDSLVAALAQPGAGMVTTLYSGRAATRSVTGQLGASYINHSFIGGALVGRALGREDCLGATMALTRSTLEQIGGFAALANELADDAVLGHLVRAQGLSVAMARTIAATTVAETQLPDLFQHELRWARTTKSVAPAAFPFSALQYPLFWAALAIGLSEGASWAWLAFAAAWAIRGLIAYSVDRQLQVPSAITIWLLPLRDLLSMTVLLASYGSDEVAWRGRALRVNRPSFVAAGKG